MKLLSKTAAVLLSVIAVVSYPAFFSKAANAENCTRKTAVCTSTKYGNAQTGGLTVNFGGTKIQLPVIGSKTGTDCGQGQSSADNTVTVRAQGSKNSSPSVKNKIASRVDGAKQTAAQSDGTGFNTAYEAEVLRLVNAERKKQGLSALTSDTGAVKAAHIRAKEIVKTFSHTRPDGSSCFTAAKEAGVTYRTAGENIAYGYGTPEQVVKGWMNSEGHRRNILSSSYTKIGIGCYKSGGVLYWTQFFIG